MPKTLQFLGAAALLGWTALGLFAWSRVQKKVRVVLQEDLEPRTEELALLEDRLDALSGDLEALVASLDENFGRLAEGVERSAVDESADRVRLERRLATLQASLVEIAEARESAGERPTEPVERPARIEPDAGDAGSESDLVAEPAPRAPAPSRPPVEPAPRRSFLAFRLPSRDFSFEGRQTFDVLGDLSRVGFDAKSTLHDFSGASDRVRGSFAVDLSDPAAGIEGRVEIATGSLGTGLEGRDDAMLEHLDAESFEEIAFTPVGFEPRRVDPEGMRLAGTLRGRMTIRGVTRDLAMDVDAHVDESRRLVIEGEAPLLLGDYEVPVPSKLGLISMEEEVRVWIHLRARARVPSAGGGA